MLTYASLKTNPRQLAALTTIQPTEFEFLLRAFAPRSEAFFRYRTWEGKLRQQPRYQPQADEKLADPAGQLFLVPLRRSDGLPQEPPPARIPGCPLRPFARLGFRAGASLVGLAQRDPDGPGTESLPGQRRVAGAVGPPASQDPQPGRHRTGSGPLNRPRRSAGGILGRSAAR